MYIEFLIAVLFQVNMSEILKTRFRKLFNHFEHQMYIVILSDK